MIRYFSFDKFKDLSSHIVSNIYGIQEIKFIKSNSLLKKLRDRNCFYDDGIHSRSNNRSLNLGSHRW